mmetsp:Transcript_73866/g.208509  ORF Transcript_73866/g.208509 Transcript_73866/m.208509 type:complete len:296 (+) Transcript_73866:29-916(+)
MGVASLAEGLDAMISCLDCLGTTSGDDGSIDTLLFVDVDGVLNIGIGDPGDAAVYFNGDNVQKAQQLWEEGKGQSGELVERLISTYNREVHGEGATCAKFLSSQKVHVSPELLSRLATIIQAAGDECTVVLSSTWRHPKHAKRVRLLEEALSSDLGYAFTFHARTSLVPDNKYPYERLRTIGDFVEEYGKQHPGSSQHKWRVLVLDDFHIHALDGGWSLDGALMDSVGAAEAYLRTRIPASPDSVPVKIVHTFESWTTPSGLDMRVGIGLTQEHLCSAMKFLTGKPCPHCVGGGA